MWLTSPVTMAMLPSPRSAARARMYSRWPREFETAVIRAPG
jgi:hypothetical protein